jgi:ABC-type lipoprotein export system ATPase subunit
MFRQIVALEEAALIVATHDPVVYDYATAVYELDDGKLTRFSPSEETSDH